MGHPEIPRGDDRGSISGSVVVTGAAKGIGFAIAAGLVGRRVPVAGLDIDRQAVQEAAQRLGPLFEPVIGDITDADAHARAANAAQRKQPLRGWVNNAGIDVIGAAHEMTAVGTEAGLRALLLGPMLGTSEAVRRMLASGGGAIVNISSIQGVASFPGHYVYCAAKAGLLLATKSVAVDYATAGIRANAVLPGCIETPMTYSSLPPELTREEALQREGELAPMLRVGQPGEVAEAVLFLLSDHAAYLTGAEIVVDGGATARCFSYPPMDFASTRRVQAETGRSSGHMRRSSCDGT
jgi:NAD(P)-dependent dehydrogenase (short-subunit alcohol dehydrogenase family)